MISILKLAHSTALSVALFALSQTPAVAGGTTMPNLIEQGYTIIDKYEFDRKESGVFPYENLVRVVSETRYKLQRGGAVAQCTFVRDTQQETMSEDCIINN
ncbi:MAG: hypothetical protein AAF352_05335 [Pseudomonadota bacterium]